MLAGSGSDGAFEADRAVLFRADNARAGRGRPTDEPSRRCGRSWRCAVKRAPAGAESPKGGSAPRDRRRSRPRRVRGRRRTPVRAPGRRANCGCSCRGSIAEVGATHLLPVVEESREALRDVAGVAVGGERLMARRPLHPPRTGAGAIRANVQGNANRSARSQGRDHTGGRRPGLACPWSLTRPREMKP